MYNSEKCVEFELSNLLNKTNFEKSHIFFNPNENDVLKDLFKNCSKTNKKKFGIPDRIYFNGETLIIFECKTELKKCIKDITHYIKNLNFKEISNIKNIFGVAFVSESCYEIFHYLLSIRKKDSSNGTIQINTGTDKEE